MKRPDRSTNRGKDRYAEPSRVITLCGLFAMGATLAAIGIVQLFAPSGQAWLLIPLGAGIALIAALILKLDPPGRRRR